tara:strand:+ start:131 stop:1468 length:1338 start_codon:yes stop_codon:yes gene_type:complete
MAIEFLDDVKVEAGLEVTGTIKDSDGDVGTAGQVLSSTSTATDWIDAAVNTNIGTTNLTTSDTARTLTLNAAGASASKFTIKKTNATDAIIQFSDGATLINDTFILANNNINVGGAITLREAGTNGLHYISLNAPSSLAGNNAYVLPNAFPTSDKVLQSTSAGAMSWVPAAVNTNIANDNLTLDNNRTLDVDGNTLVFDVNGGDINFTDSAGGPSSYIKTEQGYLSLMGLVFPTSDGSANQVLKTNGSGTLSFATVQSAPSLIASGGGRVYMATSSDANARAIVLGGSIGFGFYNWSTPLISYSNLSFTGLGTPNSSTTNVTPSSGAQGAFQVLKSGTIKVQGTCEGQNNANLYSANVYILVFKIPASIVTAMGNGGIQSTAAYTLVASATCTMPTSSLSSKPQSFESSNGVSVSAGDWVFASLASDATVTATRYFYTNFQMYTS